MANERTLGELTLTDEGQHGLGLLIKRGDEAIGFIHAAADGGGYYARGVKPNRAYAGRSHHATEGDAIAAAVAARDAPEPDDSAEAIAAEIAAAKQG